MDRSLYTEYQMERFKNESQGNIKKPDFSLVMEKPVFNTKKRICLPTIESLDNDHSAKKYMIKRKIPKQYLTKTYYANDFKEFIDDLMPGHDKELRSEDPRIVIPFYDEKNNLLGVQGRAVGESKVKYITIKIADENQKVFGLDTLDKNKTIYVVEGPIDSMFIKNSIAMMDATLYNAVSYVGNYDYVFVYDRDPRNAQICKHIKKTIDMGHKVCLFPDNIRGKDINEFVLNGILPENIMSLVTKYTHQGLRAKLEFEQWKKI